MNVPVQLNVNAVLVEEILKTGKLAVAFADLKQKYSLVVIANISFNSLTI